MAVHKNLGNFVAIKQIDLKKKISQAQLSSLMVSFKLEFFEIIQKGKKNNNVM
jgi:hypothetical protein